MTLTSRTLNSYSSQNIAYGNGKYLSVGSGSIQGTRNGSVQSDNGSTFNYSNESFSEWGYRVLSSTDDGNSWQLLDNVSFNNPRGITYGNGDFLTLTDNSTWASSDGGITWHERGSIANLSLPDLALVQGDPLPEGGSIYTGSMTLTSRTLNSFGSQDIAYGNGKYLSIGNVWIQGTKNGTGQADSDNGSGIQSFNYSNESYSEWGYRVLSSTDNGNSWQLLDNASFNNPRGITFGNGEFLVLTDNSTWASSDGGYSWQERGNITNLSLPDLALVQGDPLPEGGSIYTGSMTLTSRTLNSYSSQDIAYGNGKYLSVGNVSIQGTKNGTGQADSDNGSGIQSFNYSNESYSEWGYRVLSSSDNGNSWQLLDNTSFNNPRSITAYH